MADTPLAGKTALVTGAAKRLGRDVALALAEQGAGVVVHYRSSQADAEGTCEELRRLSADAWSVQADLGSAEDAAQLLQAAVALAGPVDILVNNASVFDPSTLADVDFEQVTSNAAVNAWAPFVLMRAFAEQGRPGRIVNLLDTRVSGYDWRHVAYILSKNMLELLTRMAALKYAPDVTVNAVAPGLILPPPGQDVEYLERLANTVPLNRHGGAEDIVDAVLFLIHSPFITGQTIFVDGGAHLKR